MQHRTILLTVFSLLVFPLTAAFAALDPQTEAMRQGSVARAQQTATVKPTVQIVMDKVEQAAQLVAELGPAAFPRFKGADSEFIYAGTYVWIHSAKSGVMLMHPMIPTLEGQNVLFMRDKNGKMMFVDFNRAALELGGGWVDYLWPKPGETEPSLKVSYVKRVDYGNERYVVGSGVYDIALEDLPKAVGQ
jgi:signal transduction histidine kinase